MEPPQCKKIKKLILHWTCHVFHSFHSKWVKAFFFFILVIRNKKVHVRTNIFSVFITYIFFWSIKMAISEFISQLVELFLFSHTIPKILPNQFNFTLTQPSPHASHPPKESAILSKHFNFNVQSIIQIHHTYFTSS